MKGALDSVCSAETDRKPPGWGEDPEEEGPSEHGSPLPSPGPHAAPPERCSPNLTLLPKKTLQPPPRVGGYGLWTPAPRPPGRRSPRVRGQAWGGQVGRSDAQARGPRGTQARLGLGCSFLLSLSLFLSSFLVLGAWHPLWAWTHQSPAPRIAKSKRSSSPLAKRQE